MEDYFDRLPVEVRRRLADSRHNICAACLMQEARRQSPRRRRQPPTVEIYFALIAAIEQSLDSDRQPELGPKGCLDDLP
jgi:hypothetical protein